MGEFFSLADDFYQHAFAADAVKFPVENLFPGAEVEFAVRDGDDYFAAHDAALEMGVGVIFARVVLVLGVGFFRGEFFQPNGKIMMKAGFIIIDEDGRGDVHGIAQDKAFFDAAFLHGICYFGCDVDEGDPRFCLKD